mmetsp:Transcript_23752/g.22859  ORF Transcript_23752/g.22859 Transcript_23752/m.22859 type:complete len:115 (+) Transcript_23752:418-762(+)
MIFIQKNSAYTQKFQKCTVKWNESEWSKTKVSADNKGLCKDLILLAAKVAKTVDLSETVDLNELDKRVKLKTEVCRIIIAKVKQFLDLKELHLKEMKGKKNQRKSPKKEKKVEL